MLEERKEPKGRHHVARFSACVNLYVLSQAARLREHLAERLAGAGFLPRMQAACPSSGCRTPRTPCRTSHTNMQLLPHVRGQAAGLAEPLAARLTDMRFLPLMRPHVRSQVAGIRKPSATRLADVGFLPRMHPHVHNQVVGPKENPVARPAYM